MKKRIILQKEELNACITRMAGEIVETNDDLEDLILVGIRTGGAFLAARIREAIAGMGMPAPAKCPIITWWLR